MPPTDGDKPYSTKQVRDSLDHLTFGVGVLTLVLLAVYTGINYYLYRTMADSFHADQRPWVGVTYISIDKFQPRTDGTLLPIGEIGMKNFGPRVARKVVFVGGFITDHWSDQVCKDAERDCGAAWSFAVGAETQGWSSPSNGKPIGATLFPEEEYRKRLDTNGPLGALVLTEILPTYIYVPACVVYLDQFGEKHKTRVCFQARYTGSPDEPLAKNDWQQCNECNDAR